MYFCKKSKMSLISREIANELDYNVGYDGHYDYVFIIDSHDNITPVPYETGKKFRFIPRPSYDDLRDWLRYAYDIDIDIVTIPTFSYANNQGVKIAKGDYLLFLNIPISISVSTKFLLHPNDINPTFIFIHPYINLYFLYANKTNSLTFSPLKSIMLISILN